MIAIAGLLLRSWSIAILSQGMEKAEPDATREWLNKRSAATRGFMMNCVKRLNVYQRRTSIPTRNFLWLSTQLLVKVEWDAI